MNSQPDPVEAEATGQTHVVVEYKGHDFKIPLDVDTWPLRLVYDSVGVRAGKLITLRAALSQAMSTILGDQFHSFLNAFPKSRDLLPASQALACAVGLPGKDCDLAFGAVPRLLVTLEQYPAAVEATLANFGLDYRDRWRFDADGHRKLTLRRIYVALSNAPLDSPLAIAQNDGKMPLSNADTLLMDVYEAVARQPHPSRPMSSEQKAVRSSGDSVADAVADYRKRHAPKPTPTPRETQRSDAVATATANARQRKAAAHARSQ